MGIDKPTRTTAGCAIALTWLFCGCAASRGLEPERIHLTNQHAASLDVVLDIQSYPVCERCDVVLEWGDVTSDILGNPLEPGEDVIATAITIYAGFTEQELEEWLSESRITQEPPITLFFEPDGATSAHLSDHTMWGTDVGIVDWFTSDDFVWLLSLRSDDLYTDLGGLAAFLSPDPNSSVSRVELRDGSTDVGVIADLLALPPVEVPLGTAFAVDWSAIDTDGFGDHLELESIDQIVVEHFEHVALSGLDSTNVWEFESLSSRRWIADVNVETELDVTALGGAHGRFEGITAEGTWLLSLRSSSTKTPRFLAALTVP